MATCQVKNILSEIESNLLKFDGLSANIIFGYYNEDHGIYKLKADFFSKINEYLKKKTKKINILKLQRQIYGSLEKQIGNTITYIKKKPRYDLMEKNMALYISQINRIDEEEFPNITKYHMDYKEDITLYNIGKLNISSVLENNNDKKKSVIRSIRISFKMNIKDKKEILNNLKEILNDIINLLF